MERERIAEHSKGVGKPKVGGPFELVDQDGREWKSTEKMDGKYSLVSISAERLEHSAGPLALTRRCC